MDWKTYSSLVQKERRNNHRVERHHVLPIHIRGPDAKENIAEVLQADHIKIHKELDIPRRYLNDMVRNQRKWENGHVILNEKDIIGRAKIQEAYLQNVHNLPDRAEEMHEIKLGELLTLEAGKLQKVTGKIYGVELGDTLFNHKQYTEVRIIYSKYVKELILDNIPGTKPEKV